MMTSSLQSTHNSLSQTLIPSGLKELLHEHFSQNQAWTDKEKDHTEALEECLRFLYLLSVTPSLRSRFIPVCDDTDQIWHYLIIQTRFYSDLCKKLPSGEFIHHGSISFDHYLDAQNSSDDRSQIFSEFLEWIPHYLRHFGEFTPAASKYWKIIDILHQQGLSLEDINQLGSQLKNPEA